MTPPSFATVCSMLGCVNTRRPGSIWCEPCERVLIGKPVAEQFATKAKMPELFDPAPAPTAPAALTATKRPRARRTDRSTSQRASDTAARQLTTKQRAVLSIFAAYGMLHDEALVYFYREQRSAQLARGYGPLVPDLTESSIRTRRAELVRLGRVRDTGRETTTVRGGPTAVWEMVDTAASHEPASAAPRAETPPPAAE